jgi:hypothetical protein
MAGLSDGLRLGGVYADVGLNFDQLDADLSELQRRLDKAGQSARVTATVASSDSSSSGGGGGGIGTGTALMAVSVVSAEIRRMTQQVNRAMDGAVDQLRKVAASVKTVADATRGTTKAAHDLYREQDRQSHVASIQHYAGNLMGRSSKIDRGTGYERLPADVRYLAGAGFNRQISAVSTDKAGTPKAVATEVAPIVREMAGTVTKAVVEAAGRITKAGGYAMVPGRHTAAGSSTPGYDMVEPGHPQIAPDTSRYRRRSGKVDLGAVGAAAQFGVGAAGGAIVGTLRASKERHGGGHTGSDRGPICRPQDGSINPVRGKGGRNAGKLRGSNPRRMISHSILPHQMWQSGTVRKSDCAMRSDVAVSDSGRPRSGGRVDGTLSATLQSPGARTTPPAPLPNS